MTSTPSDWSFRASRTFSFRFIEQPGDCSPSRKVVSKILTRWIVITHRASRSPLSYRNPRPRTLESQSYNFYEKISSCDNITADVNADKFEGTSGAMDIPQLEVFWSVAQEKSFPRAAEASHRTQPAVSQAIRRLEVELGESLFDRSSKD